METPRHVQGLGSHGIGAITTQLPDVDQAWPGLIQASTILCDGVAASGSEKDEVFQDVVERAISIFRREESSMDLFQAPRADVHRQGHLAILNTIARLRREYKEDGGSPELAQRMRAELLDFLREHHVLLDAMLGRHIRDQGGKASAFDD